MSASHSESTDEVLYAVADLRPVRSDRMAGPRITLHKGDLAQGITFPGAVAVDTETLDQFVEAETS